MIQNLNNALKYERKRKEKEKLQKIYKEIEKKHNEYIKKVNEQHEKYMKEMDKKHKKRMKELSYYLDKLEIVYNILFVLVFYCSFIFCVYNKNIEATIASIFA